MKIHRVLLLLSACLLPTLCANTAPTPAQDPFLLNVRTTDPLSAQEEQSKFHLPPGFEIQLVASEPDIGKPFNIAFDAKGRLWITVSKSYPFPAPQGGEAMDRIMILSDFDQNGKAQKIETFADHLSIPIGVYPYQDGCIAYSIPNISAYHDTKDNGKADKIDPLYGPFGFQRDTHGMTNNFRRGFDGWLYATHGFNNQSDPKSYKTGEGISMHSGNTYRMKLDGSQLQQFSWGQTNPFGFIFDPLGNAYSSECELMPVSQLIRGGYFEGLGKQHDGLGFAPRFINHMHGSTAIASLFLAPPNWPVEYQNNFFIGNVVTCRINRDALRYEGATPIGDMRPDFLTVDDPWFRPVTMQVATDGSLFIGDFYNRIIGHYEVPLTHPGRDHQHGRIWRIVYHDPNGKGSTASAIADQTKETVEQLIADLASENFPKRMFATDQLSDRIGQSAVDPVRAMIASTSNPWQKIHGLWVLYRLNALEPAMLATAAADSAQPVRVHAMRILSETNPWSAAQQQLALAGLHDTDALVQRVAADALGQHPAFDQIQPLLDLCKRVEKDPFLLYQARVAIRDHLKQDAIMTQVAATKLDSSDANRIDAICLAVPTAPAGKYLADRLQNAQVAGDVRTACLKQAARFAPQADLDALLQSSALTTSPDLSVQANDFRAVQDGLAERGEQPDEKLRAWGAKLAEELLSPASGKKNSPGQQVGAEIAESLGLKKLAPALRKLAEDRRATLPGRIAAVKGLLTLDPDHAPKYMIALVVDNKEPMNLRDAAAQQLAQSPSADVRSQAIDAVKTTPYQMQKRLAFFLASNGPDGGEMVMKAIKDGRLTARVLQEGGVVQRLFADQLPDLKQRIADLTKGMPPADATLQALIDQRSAEYGKAKRDPAEGAKIFAKNCTVCHTLEGQGGKVGPTLDGIGNRGIARLCEDVLDPSRNVDPAFRYVTLKLKDGTIVDGLPRREEGAVQIMVDSTGKEFSVPTDQIVHRNQTNLSLMPSNFGDIIPPNDFYNLMAFLLSKNSSPTTKPTTP